MADWSLEHVQTSSVYSCFLSYLFSMAVTHFILSLSSHSFCLQLPVIGKSLGKRSFKRHLELFLDAIFYGLVSVLGENKLIVIVAEEGDIVHYYKQLP